MVAAAFATDARYSGFRPDPAAIFETISDRLRATTLTVLDAAERQDAIPHTAGRCLAEDRVRAAMHSRGRIARS
ncbi:hypothetical protein AB0K02_25020 [Streptomyces sp. NPDC049597]|uniref:hypothetical protein n=1 Tax=Streptomyces sp. NPDC049597 TaxID=3155276 RepID=UPI0034168051